jgi:hypothetical protein
VEHRRRCGSFANDSYFALALVIVVLTIASITGAARGD